MWCFISQKGLKEKKKRRTDQNKTDETLNAFWSSAFEIAWYVITLISNAITQGRKKES